MKPTDYRNATFAEIEKNLIGLRQRVYFAWKNHGPGTTEQVAMASGIGLLTFRPRSTELLQMGLIRLMTPEALKALPTRCDTPRNAHEGVYEAVPLKERQDAHAARQARADEQTLMNV